MTLIELLTVVGIMAILMSLIVVAVFAFQKSGQRKATISLLDHLVIGLEQYKSQHRMYPPSDPAQTAEGAFILWYALEEKEKHADVEETYKGTAEPATYTADADGHFRFNDPNSGEPKTKRYYQDRWNQPLRYECLGPSYKSSTITSIGPDGAPGTDDDIVKEQ